MTWTPTAENINALEPGLRDWILRLEANTDPAGEVRRRVLAEQRVLELARLVEERKWRPIESAPVDVEVWLFDQDTDPKQYAAKLVEREYEEGGYYWRPAEELVADVLDYELTPTHWMPLPEPPNVEVDDGRG